VRERERERERKWMRIRITDINPEEGMGLRTQEGDG
jgi:hypothetical protein